MNDDVNQLFQEQLINWELAKNNYQALKQVKVKTLDVDGRPYQVQFNPARLISTAAKTDSLSISGRPCFLCSANRPAEQKEVLFKGRYTILVNPYPIFPRHLTIPAVKHTPQFIASRFDDMLDLAQQLDDYIVFYNGPKCGASAPDHFHFQAGSKGFLPIENNRKWKYAIRIESEDKQNMLRRFGQLYDALHIQPGDSEPMMNVITWYGNRMWTTCIFPRKKHRPVCYSAEGDAHLLISLAAVDMGGMLITPLEKDFIKITAEDIAKVLNEVSEKVYL